MDRVTKSGFREEVGIGYALEKIEDPGRGRKDEVSLNLAIGSLRSIRAEHDRIKGWAESNRISIDPLLAELAEAISDCEEVLQNFKTQPPARKAGAKVRATLDAVWSVIRRH